MVGGFEGGGGVICEGVWVVSVEVEDVGGGGLLGEGGSDEDAVDELGGAAEDEGVLFLLG